MGPIKRLKKKSKSRGNVAVELREKQDDVIVDLNVQNDKFDESNPLVLSGSKKKKTKIVERVQAAPKILSRKQKKNLQKVLARKKKKLNRSELLEKLREVQAKPEELELLTSTSCMQTFGLKRIAGMTSQVTETQRKRPFKIKTIKGINKKLKYGCNEPSSSSSDESSEENSSESESKTNAHEEDDDSEIEIEDIHTEPSDLKETTEPLKSQTESVTKVAVKEVPLIKVKSNEKVEPKPAIFVRVERKKEVQATREALPIFSEEQSIVEAINENPVVIIHGETGSGKTTQVPQFLYEAGYTQSGKVIGITEPRRIAAMTMAARVGEEMSMPEKVSYHIRYKKTVGKETEIKFMTDGVLLKELAQDFYLTKYSVIIIDEAHERSVFSDVLIGLLSRIVPLREKRKDPLKLIIMSATINVEDFTNNPKLFKIQPLLIQIGSRQHRIQVHFNLVTPDNYVEAAFKKVCKIHAKLPPGAILVFVTGEKEVQRLCQMLKEAFPMKSRVSTNQPGQLEEKQIPSEPVLVKKRYHKRMTAANHSDSFCALPPNINLDDYSVEPLNTEDQQHQQSDEENEDPAENITIKSFESSCPLHVLPLYSILPFKEQEKVFKPPPEGSRLCVVSTNVAETSITIPGLKYVVDTGKVKTKVYSNDSGGISKFEIVWCSKASANQRAGRCGRTEGGHCYRLYSSAVFDKEFPDYSLAEIQRIPVDDVLLQMKALGIDRVVEFPFPTPPDKESLKSAERRLVALGALQNLQKGERYRDLAKWEFSAKVTPLGRAMSHFPLSPRYAKMLLLAYKHKCIPYIAAIVCALTVPNVFLRSTVTTETEDGEEDEKIVQEGIQKIGTGNFPQLGDVMVLLEAVRMFGNSNNGRKFCRKNGIRVEAMFEIQKMALQLLREMNRAFPDASIPEHLRLDRPDTSTLENIRKIVTACCIDQVARRMSREETKDDKNLKNAYQCMYLEEPVFIHPSSTQFSRLPEYITYNEIMRTSKLYMKGVVEVEAHWLPAFAPDLYDMQKILEKPAPRYDAEMDRICCSMEGNFGSWDWTLPVVSMEMPAGDLKYRWFCFFLLDGQICSFFKKYRTDYISSPSTMIMSWAHIVQRVVHLLRAVIAKNVDSRSALQKVWESDPKYLLREFLEWVPATKNMEIEFNWPPKMKHSLANTNDDQL